MSNSSNCLPLKVVGVCLAGALVASSLAITLVACPSYSYAVETPCYMRLEPPDERSAPAPVTVQVQAEVEAPVDDSYESYIDYTPVEVIDAPLDYLINRESGGDIFATNGQYCGIGQLSENKYPHYIGMTYEETLLQEDPYAIQLEAMLAYIYDRYGTIENAAEHSRQMGWY